MKIVIDVSVIGLGQLFETARTGIYRVMSNLALELLSRDELDLSFASLSSLQVNRLTARYFAEHNLGNRYFPQNSIEKFLANLPASSQKEQKPEFVHKVISKLYRISRTRRIGRTADLFHSHYSPLPCFSGHNTPVRILTIYDIIPFIHPEYFAEGFVDEFRPIVESFNPQNDYVFTISECSKKDICSWFKMDPDRVFVNPPAASQELYFPVQDARQITSVQEKFNIPQGRYFLTLATVEKRKNLRTAISCFRNILQETGDKDLYFVLVGTRGWKVSDVFAEIASDPLLKDRVVFTGFVPDEYLSSLYSGAIAFIYPSLYEGFGLPPLEAMQCGLPVIASGSSSLPEVVADAGILVDPLDTDHISQAMLTLLQDRDVHAEYVAKGLARAEKFTWKHCADLTIDAYQKIWAG